MLMKRMKQRAARSDEQARQQRKRMRGDETEEVAGREQAQRPMSLVFDELLHNKPSLV